MVSSGERIEDLLEPAERNIHLRDGLPIGALRNAGCEAACGEIIAHFDDDDFSGPRRITDQVERLLSSPGCQVTGYRAMRFTDGSSWWRYEGPAKYALGTSLVYRREWWAGHKFPEVMVGEDNGFAAQAAARGALIATDAGEHQWATIHDGNTSPRKTDKGKAWVRL